MTPAEIAADIPPPPYQAFHDSTDEVLITYCDGTTAQVFGEPGRALAIAQFMVKRINAHDRLVEVLDRVLREAEGMSKGTTTWPFAHKLLEELK